MTDELCTYRVPNFPLSFLNIFRSQTQKAFQIKQHPARAQNRNAATQSACATLLTGGGAFVAAGLAGPACKIRESAQGGSSLRRTRKEREREKKKETVVFTLTASKQRTLIHKAANTHSYPPLC